jgi:uncharacterized low-complexity protein
MKQLLLSAALSTAALASFGQADSTPTASKVDTIRIGNMVIIKKQDANGTTYESKSATGRSQSGPRKPRRVATSWLNLDLGFANFQDKTDYASAAARAYARPQAGGPVFTSSDFNLRPAKSVNVNLWIFRQRLGLTKDRVLRLTYGLMLEMNNYRFDTDLRTTYVKGSDPHVTRSADKFRKNKLALDYVTLPLMLGIDTRPGRSGGLTLSGGVSVGYLYSSRNKQIGPHGKQKIRGNFDIEPWKLSYVAEVGLGPVMLYGSYAPNSLYKAGLDHMPYNVGLRFGDWNKW